MALRDFRCTKCGEVREHLVRAGDSLPRPDKCPNESCGAEGVLVREPGVAATSFKLSGNGWARDGYSTTSRSRT